MDIKWTTGSDPDKCDAEVGRFSLSVWECRPEKWTSSVWYTEPDGTEGMEITGHQHDTKEAAMDQIEEFIHSIVLNGAERIAELEAELIEARKAPTRPPGEPPWVSSAEASPSAMADEPPSNHPM